MDCSWMVKRILEWKAVGLLTDRKTKTKMAGWYV
jgi:hypothetical protein